ncbi:MAG TPA: helix-turn-helix domain-containing protein [Ktedonobacteraceae bacterium]|nr:helix-turn-helix domain-containing protein [Ktedonobacteraceae bacterium]
MYRRRKGANVSAFDDILDADEVGRILKIHPRTVKRLASQGMLPGFRVGGQWRFRRGALEEYIRRQEQQHDHQKEED